MCHSMLSESALVRFTSIRTNLICVFIGFGTTDNYIVLRLDDHDFAVIRSNLNSVQR